ncbi:hypothetical protein O9929_24255 [Vibrio lentus]|nr:hypothetical protein [Vibrio lentus]
MVLLFSHCQGSVSWTHHDVKLQEKMLGRFRRRAPDIMSETFDNLVQDEWVTLERNLHAHVKAWRLLLAG